MAVMVEAELDPEFPPIGPAITSPELNLIEIIRNDGEMAVTCPDGMYYHPYDKGPTLLQISANHKRSLDVPKDLVPHTLGDISVKGGVLEDPKLWTRREDGVPYSDLRGGMVYRDAVYAYESSDTMFKRGIRFGEQILGVARLRAMPTPNGIKSVAVALPTYGRTTETGVAPIRYDTMSPALQPVVAIRSMPNSYRLWDVAYDTDSRQIYPILGRSLLISAQQAPEFVGGLNSEDKSDLRTYLAEHVPTLVGYAYGRLTAAGLKQKYAHGGNMSLSLGLPDADAISETHRITKGYRDSIADFCAESVMDSRAILGGNRGRDREQQTEAVKDSFLYGYRMGQKEKHVNEL